MAYDEYPVEMIRFFGPDDAQALVTEATDTFARHDHDGVGYLTTAYVGTLVERHVRDGPPKEASKGTVLQGWLCNASLQFAPQTDVSLHPCRCDAKVRSILRDAPADHVAAVIKAFLGMLGVNTESGDDVIKLQGTSVLRKRICLCKKNFLFLRCSVRACFVQSGEHTSSYGGLAVAVLSPPMRCPTRYEFASKKQSYIDL